jgi:hypothetical protein
MTRADNRIVTAHWYQLGDARYTSSNAGRLEISRFWGKTEWPPLVKVLLHIPARNIEEAAPRLEHFATEVNAWTSLVK